MYAYISIVAVALLVLAGGLINYVVISAQARSKITKNLRMDYPAHSKYNEWLQDTDFSPKYVDVYFFAVSNGANFSWGTERLKVQETGPWSYRIHESKRNVTFSSDRSQVRYRLTTRYEFVPSRSTSREDVLLNVVNPYYIGVVSTLRNESLVPVLLTLSQWHAYSSELWGTDRSAVHPLYSGLCSFARYFANSSSLLSAAESRHTLGVLHDAARLRSFIDWMALTEDASDNRIVAESRVDLLFSPLPLPWFLYTKIYDYLLHGIDEDGVVSFMRMQYNVSSMGFLFRNQTVHDLLFSRDETSYALTLEERSVLFNETEGASRNCYRTVKTGSSDDKQLGLDIYTEYDNVTVLNSFSGKASNLSDRSSTIEPFEGVPPNFVRLFSPSTMYYFRATYRSIRTVSDVHTAVYVPDRSYVFENSNPRNGFLDIQSVRPGAPWFASLPHMKYASTQRRSAIIGMKELGSKELNTELYVEPSSGSHVRSNERMQLNVLLNATVAPFGISLRGTNASTIDLFLPLLWSDTIREIGPARAHELERDVTRVIMVRRVVLGVCVAITVVMILAAASLRGQQSPPLPKEVDGALASTEGDPAASKLHLPRDDAPFGNPMAVGPVASSPRNTQVRN